MNEKLTRSFAPNQLRSTHFQMLEGKNPLDELVICDSFFDPFDVKRQFANQGRYVVRDDISYTVLHKKKKNRVIRNGSELRQMRMQFAAPSQPRGEYVRHSVWEPIDVVNKTKWWRPWLTNPNFWMTELDFRLKWIDDCAWNHSTVSQCPKFSHPTWEFFERGLCFRPGTSKVAGANFRFWFSRARSEAQAAFVNPLGQETLTEAATTRFVPFPPLEHTQQIEKKFQRYKRHEKLLHTCLATLIDEPDPLLFAVLILTEFHVCEFTFVT